MRSIRAIELRSVGYWLFLLVAGVAVLLLNLLDAPTLSDDMIYRFVWSADEQATPQPIESLADLLRSQWVHYFSANGRFPVHLLAQACLVFVPPVVVQVANSVLFVLLVHLVSLLVSDSRRPLFVAVMATLLLLVVMQGVRTTLLWSLGAFNYLWVSVANLCFLLALQTPSDSKNRRWWLLPLAFLAGWGHEALSLPLSVAFAVLLFSPRMRPLRPYLLAYMAGTCLIFLSPALWNRAADAPTLQSRLLSAALNMVFNVRVLWLLLACLLLLWWRRRAFLLKHISRRRPVYIALAVAVAVVLVCGTNLERVAFYADLIAMLLLLNLLPHLLSAAWQRVLIGAAIVLLLAGFLPVWQARKDNYDRWLQAESQMKEPGRELIAVNLQRSTFNRYVNPSFEFGFYCSYMGFDPNDINMRCAARHYGKEKMVFLPEDIVRRALTDSLAYQHFELDSQALLYVKRVGQPTDPTRVVFELNEENTDTLTLLQRLVTYKDSIYELDNFHHHVVNIADRHYLVLTKPTTNINRRIKRIRIEK